jgi:hypothetical protein
LSTTFENKCKILTYLWNDKDFVEQLQHLWEKHDLTFPYAMGLSIGHILDISEEAESLIEMLWQEVLFAMKKVDTGYSDIFDFVE